MAMLNNQRVNSMFQNLSWNLRQMHSDRYVFTFSARVSDFAVTIPHLPPENQLPLQTTAEDAWEVALQLENMVSPHIELVSTSHWPAWDPT